MKVGIIADDLTGANATGVRMSENGFVPATYFHYNEIIADDEIDTIVIDTDSRYASEKVVNHRMDNAIRKLADWNADFFCKRVDSTLRGNVGLELDLILKAAGDDSIAVVVPSFPDSGRITVGGYLVVDNVPLHKTDAANDPITPISTSYIPDIINSQTEHPVSLITINDMEDDPEALKKKFLNLAEDGNRIIIIDAVTNNDVEFIASALSQVDDYPIIPVDPGPFTAMYSKYKANGNTEEGKIIVTVGSATKVSQRQLIYLIDRLKLNPVFPDVHQLATFDDRWQLEIERCVEEAKLKMDDNEVTLITTNKENLVILNLQEIADENNTTPDRVAKRLTDGLATITKKLLDESAHEVKGIYVSGGDVTASLTSIMFASGIKLKDEVSPLTAYGHLLGGEYEGLPLVTKGGMIGDKRTLYESIQYLKMT